MSFWDTYDWDKASKGTFAPPSIPGNTQSEAALAAWNLARPQITPAILEASRGPPTTPAGAPVTQIDPVLLASYQAKGANLPQPAVGSSALNIGPVDPMALKALAQHLPYDVDARRNAIAAQLVGQQGAGLGGTTATPPPTSTDTHFSTGQGITNNDAWIRSGGKRGVQGDTNLYSGPWP